MTEFKVPELGENVVGGEVTRLLVAVGDTIALDQPVLELETDKATIELPSSVAGKIISLHVAQGDKVQVGAPVFTVEEAAGTPAEPGDARAPAKADKQSAPSGQKPDKVVAMPARQAPEPSKTRPAATSPAQAIEPRALSPEPRGPSPEPRASSPEPRTPNPEPRVPSPEPRGPSPAAPAAPSVRRLAREVGVDINDVRGSGAQGRISEGDVKEHARRILSSVGAGASREPLDRGPSPPLPDFERWGEIDRQPMSNIRRITADRLSHAWNAIPHVTQFDKADITGMEAVRQKYREQVERAGGNLTVTAMLVKVIAMAVKHFPQFNASLDPRANEIVFKKYVNVGVAVDTDRGLLVPVVRNADQKNITEIAVEVHQAAEKARSRKLSLDEMSGGGITISNLGGLGGTYFTPIINWPEVAILGVSRGAMEPVWRNGSFEPRQQLPLSLSYDHRVIDGADAMRFLRWVVEAIEQPFVLSLLG